MVRPVDYRTLLREVRDVGATLDVDHGRLLIVGEIPPALKDRLWDYEAEIVSLLEIEKGVDVRTAALDLWEWLEGGRLAAIKRPIVIQPGVTVLPQHLEFVARQELRLAKGSSHRAQRSKDNVRAMHRALVGLVEG